METLKTCLHDKHLALGAKMMPFGGFDMPIEYTSIVEEHNAVRHAAGIFDVSHMGEILIKGEDSEKYINHIFTNNISGGAIGKIFYGMMLYPTGGVVDDLLVYKKGDKEFFLVVNAANIAKDYDWMVENSKGYNVEIINQSDYYGEVAVQGTKAFEAIEKYIGIEVNDLEFYTFKELQYEGETIIVSRTGYTGEDGFELYGSHKFINKAWDLLVQSKEVLPCGLGCRDTLRFEVGLPLYGHELDHDITPLEAGLGVFVKLDKEEFIGKDAIAKQKAEGVKRKIVGIELVDKAIPRNGYDVEVNGQKIGYVTTGYNSISTGKSVCLALIDSEYATLDTEVDVRIRKKEFKGHVVKKRFYEKHYKK